MFELNNFTRGDRAYLEDAFIVRDRRGDVLCGRIYDDTRALKSDGEKVFTSHLINMIYDDVYLSKSGMTYFIRSWKASDYAPADA